MSTPRDVLADAQRFYRRCIYHSWVHDYMSGRYLAGMIASAGIGYAPRGWTTTTDYLLQLGHSPERIIAAGVAVRTDRGLRDVMRDRLIFPMHDHAGNLVAFVGRAAADAAIDRPKYLNTPATELYDKGSTLYGLGERFDALRAGGVPLIVEGPMDKLATDRAVAESGANVVALASCGTSLTREHLDRISSVATQPVWFCFDSDNAGRHALLRAWDLTQDGGLARQMVVRLPKGRDPASVHPRTLNAAIASPVAMSVAVAKVQLDVWGQPDNAARAALMVSELARRDGQRIAADDAGAWVQVVAEGTGVPIMDVQASLLEAITGQPTSSAMWLRDACFPAVAGAVSGPTALAGPTRAHRLSTPAMMHMGR